MTKRIKIVEEYRNGKFEEKVNGMLSEGWSIENIASVPHRYEWCGSSSGHGHSQTHYTALHVAILSIEK